MSILISRAVRRGLAVITLACPAVAGAQDGWVRAMDKAARLDAPPEQVDRTGVCVRGARGGDSLLVVSGSRGTTHAEVWSTDYGRGLWRPVFVSAPADTLRAALAGVRCGDRQALLVEADRRYLRITPTDLPTSNELEDSSVFRSRSGALVHLLSRDSTGAWAAEPLVHEYDFDKTPAEEWVTTHRLAGEDKARRRRADSVATAATEQARADSISVKRWPAAMKKLVREKRVAIGMSAEMVRLSWGAPEHINRSITTSGTHEQWVYGGGTYVYLTSGRVTSLQDSR